VECIGKKQKIHYSSEIGFGSCVEDICRGHWQKSGSLSELLFWNNKKCLSQILAWVLSREPAASYQDQLFFTSWSAHQL
jgi:hypothetical protein